MPYKKLIRQNQFPYHVYSRSNNKDWFKIPLYQMWDICYECLVYANEAIPVQIHSFVLMGNHYHLLVTTPNGDLDKFMYHFNGKLSREIRKYRGAENHKFGSRYKWTIVATPSYLHNIYRYIYQNPVRAGLCELCSDYPYSSLRFSPSQTFKLKIKVHISYFENREFMETNNGAEFLEIIRKGLRKNNFQIPAKTRKFIKDKFDETCK
jgi:putative transposase